MEHFSQIQQNQSSITTEVANTIDGAKVLKEIEPTKLQKLILHYFNKNTGTALDFFYEYGIIPSSITATINAFRDCGRLRVVGKCRDKHSGHLARQLSANPEVWAKCEAEKRRREPSLFDCLNDDEDEEGVQWQKK